MPMEDKDTRILFRTDRRRKAEEVQRYLDEAKVYTLIASDNAASSALNAFLGTNPSERVQVQVNKEDYEKAVKLLTDFPFGH